MCLQGAVCQMVVHSCPLSLYDAAGLARAAGLYSRSALAPADGWFSSSFVRYSREVPCVGPGTPHNQASQACCTSRKVQRPTVTEPISGRLQAHESAIAPVYHWMR